VAFLLTKILGVLVVPPGANLLVALAGLLVMMRRPRVGGAVVAVAVLSLYAFSITPVARPYLHSLERHPPLADPAAAAEDAGAIVVLGGGRYAPAPEYGDETVSDYALVRLRYAARVQRATGLPLLVSGGVGLSEGAPEAQLMRRVLEEDFDVPVRWLEDESRNTAENAFFSRDLLAREGIVRVVLVTHAWHLHRALAAFERAGLETVPAGTGYHPEVPGPPALVDWLPTARALQMSMLASHEYVGALWYRWRY